MPTIVLATLNAKYPHCAFGLRYLLANMGELQRETILLEFGINQPTLEILDAILDQRPRIIGLGIYIWNVTETTRLVADLKRIAPDVIVVLGGPEVSYEIEEQEITRLADYVITGEADLEFRKLCHMLLERSPDSEAHHQRVLHAPVPNLSELRLPYVLYSEEDISQRVIYVEASRGCPFTCEFCLSALDIPVRQFPLDEFLEQMESLLNRGAKQFKFVDRTFNLNIRVSRSILSFFLDRLRPGLFLHFELIPDRLPDSLKDLIAQFPDGMLQFEVGIQTFNNDVSELINRHQENLLVEQNLRWLRKKTGVHIHADLIVGLPGESLESFAAGFDRLVKLEPQEIQVGILKRLRGTPIVRHDADWEMVYSPHPPYEILQNKLLKFSTVQELRRLAKYWDTIANSGNFIETTELILSRRRRIPRRESADAIADPGDDPSRDPQFETIGSPHSNAMVDGAASPFAEFRSLCTWLFNRDGRSHGIALSRMVELLHEYLTQDCARDAEDVAAALWRDYQRSGRSDKPPCLLTYLNANETEIKRASRRIHAGATRQSRHHRSPPE